MGNGRAVGLVALAYATWGVLPLYWRSLSAEPELLLGCRILFSSVFLSVLLAARGMFISSTRSLFDRRRIPYAAVSAVLVAANWLLYLYAIGTGRVLEAGLGYFICPLLTLLLGSVIFGERLSTQRRYGGLLVLVGVGFKIALVGAFPWVALGLAASFAVYLVIRKLAPSDPLENMHHEMLLLAPLAVWVLSKGVVVPHADASGWVMLALSGPVTVLPMLALSVGIRRVSLQTAALLQYLNPALTIATSLLTGTAMSNVEYAALGIVVTGVAVAFVPVSALGSLLVRLDVTASPRRVLSTAQLLVGASRGRLSPGSGAGAEVKRAPSYVPRK